ncbi:MAG: cysteine desulfurase family protein [Bacilli bacterium]|nr:cysteine desulfurase family protein [Bacilli bacterium]
MIYLDYGATTPIDPEVMETYIKTSSMFFANPTSLHQLGQKSNYQFGLAVKEIKEVLNLPNHDIVFTSNATEANNLALFGLAELQSKGRIITTRIEHASVYEVMHELEKKYEVIYLEADENGVIKMEDLKQACTKSTILVSIMWVNNVLGTIQPIREILSWLKDFPKVKVHVDIVQGLGKIHPDFPFSAIDVLTFSTHKLYGPKGIGGMLYKKGLVFQKRLFGSSAQYGIKPGTFDLSLVMATAKAIKKFHQAVDQHQTYMKELYFFLRTGLEKLPFVVINTPKEQITYYVMNISIPSIAGETIVHALEAKEIYVSTGSACSSKLKKPEKTIFSQTKDLIRSTSSIRISMSHLTTKEELQILLAALSEIGEKYG